MLTGSAKLLRKANYLLAVLALGARLGASPKERSQGGHALAPGQGATRNDDKVG